GVARLDPCRGAALYVAPSGRMAEWLCRGLQILVQRFDSASGLHRTSANASPPRPRSSQPPSIPLHAEAVLLQLGEAVDHLVQAPFEALAQIAGGESVLVGGHHLLLQRLN